MSLPLPFYEDEACVLYNADCRDILPELAPGSVDLVLTDPPYGIDYDTANNARQRGNRTGFALPSRDFPRIYGDDEPFDPSHLLRFHRLILWGANNYADKLPPAKGWIVWDKRPGLPPIDNGDCELAWTNVTGAVRRFAHRWDGVNRDSEHGERHLHPTQKPVALMHWLVARFSKPDDLILDPYMGSGPVARACSNLGRRYIGIEISEAYCAIAARRLQQSVLPLEIAG